MEVTKAHDGSLLLTYDGRLWAKWLFGAAALLAAVALYDLTIGARGDGRVIGLVLSAATLAVAAGVMFETARFRVDPARRVIEWERRWAWQRRRGTLKFEEVRHVAVEVPIGDDGIPSRRIVLHTTGGAMIPVTAGYRPDHGNRIAGAAESLRTVLGHAARPPALDAARALVASGRRLDAIKLLVDDEKLSLSEAKARVDQL
jgi:hypothetical protein